MKCGPQQYQDDTLGNFHHQPPCLLNLGRLFPAKAGLAMLGAYLFYRFASGAEKPCFQSKKGHEDRSA